MWSAANMICAAWTSHGAHCQEWVYWPEPEGQHVLYQKIEGGESKLWSAAKMISASLSFIGCTLPIGSNGQQEESCRDQKIEEG